MRRTPKLTAECRRLFEERLQRGEWNPYTKDIAEATGLTREQVRDAIWSISADQWRQVMYRSLKT